MKFGVIPNDPISTYLKTYGRNFLIRYYNPNDYFDEVHIFSLKEKNNYNLSAKLKIHGIQWFLTKTFFGIPYYVFKVSMLLKIHQINLIRAYNPLVEGLVATISGKLVRIPVVISVHTDYEQQYRTIKTHKLKWRILSLIRKVVLKNADKIVCISQHLRKQVVSIGINPGKVDVIPNRVETDLFSPEQNGLEIRELLGVKDKQVVLSVGRLDNDRYPYVEYVLRSELSVISKNPKVVFVYVGSGNRKEDLIVLSERLNVKRNTIFVGSQPREQVAKFMAMADVVICPMSGFVLLEAASSAKPIIALGLDWHPEIVRHMETGFLVNCGGAEGLGFTDTTPLSEAILFLLSNPSLGGKLGTNARKVILEKFSWKTVSKKEVDMYKHLISKNLQSNDFKL
jgi:glycosyltransferase involved in cell wall biosynthesis